MYITGDKTIMCGRKADAIKLWMVWKARGDLGMQQHVDKLFDCAKYFKQKLQEKDGFRLVLPEVKHMEKFIIIVQSNMTS